MSYAICAAVDGEVFFCLILCEQRFKGGIFTNFFTLFQED